LRDYLIGTLLGMGPGILMTVAFAGQLVNAMRHPTWGAFLMLASIGVILVCVSLLLQRFFGRRQARRDPPARDKSEGARSEPTSAQARTPAGSAQVKRERHPEESYARHPGR